MSQTINVNGQSINYPETGDTNWGDEATDFAIQTSAAFGKLGLASGTSVDIAQTLDVTGNTTLDANLSVGGNASVTGTTSLTGNVTLTNNLTVNGNTQLGNANTDTIGVTGIVNVGSGTLYVDPATNRVGINDTTPSEALDVTGNVSITGNETVGGTLGVTGDVAININKFNVTASSGNTTIAGTLGVTGASTFTGQALASDGSVSLPGISFSSDTNTGLYRIGSDNIGFSVNGSKNGELTTDGWIINQQYACFVDEKTNNTGGGTFTSGDWRTRVLNTTRGTNSITGSSLSSNQFTLPSGTYRIYAAAPAYYVGNHKAKLRNITDSSDVIIGTNERSGTSGMVDSSATRSFILGIFTIASQKTFEIQHRCASNQNTDGFGNASNFSVSEIYTVVEIWKLA